MQKSSISHTAASFSPKKKENRTEVKKTEALVAL
jgi:hypothetical protein